MCIRDRHTITTGDGLLKELEQVRERGYAVDDEELALGVRCIAATIYDYRGVVNYKMCIRDRPWHMQTGMVLQGWFPGQCGPGIPSPHFPAICGPV